MQGSLLDLELGLESRHLSLLMVTQGIPQLLLDLPQVIGVLLGQPQFGVGKALVEVVLDFGQFCDTRKVGGPHQ